LGRPRARRRTRQTYVRVVAAGRRWAVPASALLAVDDVPRAALAPLPGRGCGHRGVLLHRGAVLGAVDLAGLLARAAGDSVTTTPSSSDDSRSLPIMIARGVQEPVALIVDALVGLVTVDGEQPPSDVDAVLDLAVLELVGEEAAAD
ncbi:MAG: chemotaxis protein CheW, partial [Acidobacteriota bacterium]